MQPLSWDYTRIEYERKFLVDVARVDFTALEPYSKLLQDHYFEFGRLRLRRQTDSDTGLVKYKLTKKFEPMTPHSGRIVSMWLSEEEYAALWTLPGKPLSKCRHYFRNNGIKYALDIFAGILQGLVLCEFEGENEEELFAIPAPPFAIVEVTQDLFFTGGSLCRASPAEVQVAAGAKLHSVSVNRR